MAVVFAGGVVIVKCICTTVLLTGIDGAVEVPGHPKRGGLGVGEGIHGMITAQKM